MSDLHSVKGRKDGRTICECFCYWNRSFCLTMFFLFRFLFLLESFWPLFLIFPTGFFLTGFECFLLLKSFLPFFCYLVLKLIVLFLNVFATDITLTVWKWFFPFSIFFLLELFVSFFFWHFLLKWIFLCLIFLRLKSLLLFENVLPIFRFLFLLELFLTFFLWHFLLKWFFLFLIFLLLKSSLPFFCYFVLKLFVLFLIFLLLKSLLLFENCSSRFRFFSYWDYS